MGRWDFKEQTIELKKQDLKTIIILSISGGAIGALSAVFLSIGYSICH